MRSPSTRPASRSAGSLPRTCAARRCRSIPDRRPAPILDVADVLRDALSDLLQAETHYAPVVDGSGAIKGVLSIEIIQDFLSSAEALEEEHPAYERPLD